MSNLSINIGGTVKKEGWINLSNDKDYGDVDIVGDARALPFKDEIVDVVYSSHMLEHLTYFEASVALKEWRRTLRQHGTLLLGVPDVEAIARHFQTDPEVAFQMLYGGQDKDWNVHKSGYRFDKLAHFLVCCGFEGIARVNEFGLFRDWTCLSYIAGQNMSLNVKAIAK